MMIDGRTLASCGRRAANSEKVTINLGYVDLGHIDLMVREGFYSNRTDFIRTAIRSQLERHGEVLGRSVTRRGLDLGLRHYTRADLEKAVAAGELLEIQVLGLASIAADVTPELAPGRDRLGQRARCAARHARGQGGPRRPHPLKDCSSMYDSNVSGVLANAKAMLQRLLRVCGKSCPRGKVLPGQGGGPAPAADARGAAGNAAAAAWCQSAGPRLPGLS